MGGEEFAVYLRNTVSAEVSIAGYGDEMVWHWSLDKWWMLRA